MRKDTHARRCGGASDLRRSAHSDQRGICFKSHQLSRQQAAAWLAKKLLGCCGGGGGGGEGGAGFGGDAGSGGGDRDGGGGCVRGWRQVRMAALEVTDVESESDVDLAQKCDAYGCAQHDVKSSCLVFIKANHDGSLVRST
jgi:hypothetical protein